MNTLNKNDFEDVLGLINYCISCLKNGGKPETILSEILKSFKADEAVFLSSNGNDNGVNLANSFAISKDSSFLTQYADGYWRDDPHQPVYRAKSPKKYF